MKTLITICLLVSASMTFAFYSTKGTKIVDNNGKETQLKSLAISLFKDGAFTDLTTADYTYIKSLKFNTVDFSMVLSEIDKDKNLIPDPAVMKWLKKNAMLAKQAGLGVIFSLKEQDIETSQSSSVTFWNDLRTQSSFVRIWSFVAKAFATDQNVIGYNVVPNFEKGIEPKKYVFSLKSITSTIRSIDKNHILFINGAEILNQNKGVEFPIKENVVLLYSMFDPIEFTQQKTPWVGDRSSQKYPDFKKVSFPADLMEYKKSMGDSTFFSGSRDMGTYKSDNFLVDDTNIVAATPVLEATNIGIQGEVIFQSIMIKEYNRQGELTNDMKSIEPGAVKAPRFIAGGDNPQFKVLYQYTFDQKDVFRINSSKGKTLLYLDDQKIKVRQGYMYSITGFLKPSMTNFDSKVRLSLYFLKSASHQKAIGRDKQLLISVTESYNALAKEINLPIMVGQSGLYNTALKANGAEEYISDLFTTFDEKNVSYSFLSYNGVGYGLFKQDMFKGKEKKIQTVIIDKMK